MQTIDSGTKGKVFLFEKPISFVAEVNNKKLTAQLQSASMQEGVDYFYRIQFSDEHKDEFVIQDWKIYNGKDKTDPYCKALEKEIHAVLFSWDESKPLLCFQAEIKGEESNVWITEIVKGKFYTVHIKNSKQFDVINTNGEWSFKKTAAGIAINKAIMEMIRSGIEGLTH